MLYPRFKKLRLCVRLYVRPSAHHFHSLLGAFLTKLAMKVDIGKECPGIADG